MPVYNAGAHLARSLQSVREQTMPDWELIAVDDGSTDESRAILEASAAGDDRIRMFTQPNSGAGAARNRGLKQASAPLIAFLDADDTWSAEFLQRMTDALSECPEAALVYCGWQNLGLPGARGQPFIPPEYETAAKVEHLLGGCRWPIHAVLCRASAIRGVGAFDENLSSCMDYDLWLRMGSFRPIVRLPAVLAYYHHHGGAQITKNRARVAINHWRVQRTFLRAHPEVAAALGRARTRRLTHGELMRRGFECYWKRDLPGARNIFRLVMRFGYGRIQEWRYMLPSILPMRIHEGLLRLGEIRSREGGA
jgi:glycosyltransferase involved in cell wall biosynthesis